MKNNIKAKPEQQSDTFAFHSSPIHNLAPVYPKPVEINVAAIDLDPTNPGSLTQSLRNQRRAGSIRDSYDILAKIIYPILVCQTPEDPDRYIQVDGYGRLNEARARGQQRIDAIVYPPLSLEQRICLRQTLNAAQEPFDAVSIIRDLQELAKERGLDVGDPEQIETLVRDMPERVRKHEKDLVMLAKLHPNAVESMGESYRKDSKTIGLDKFRGLERVIRTMEQKHPRTTKSLGGAQGLSLKLSKMYTDKKFSDGSRSQDVLRKVAHTLSEASQDDPAIGDFFTNEKASTELRVAASIEQSTTANDKSPILKTCQSLTALLVGVDTEALTRAERRALERTESVLSKVLTGEMA